MQMLFCKYTFECISNSIVFYLKKQYISCWNKKENSSNFFLIILNENLLYPRIWSSFQPPPYLFAPSNPLNFVYKGTIHSFFLPQVPPCKFFCQAIQLMLPIQTNSSRPYQYTSKQLLSCTFSRSLTNNLCKSKRVQ